MASGDADRLRHLHAFLEVLVRTLAALALQDYLRGPSSPAAEDTLSRLARPSLGTWVQLLRETTRQIGARPDPAPFLPELVTALGDRHRPDATGRRARPS